MDEAQHGFWLVLLRGLVYRCPNCGEGKLFARYLKQVDACAVCGEKFAGIRADDGPAWLTIVVVGHILAPILLEIVPDSSLPSYVFMIAIPLFALALAMLILPRAKGIFIGVLWRMGKT